MYKTHKIVMIHTDEKANIFLGSELFLYSGPDNSPIKPFGYAGQHLYIVSDEEIKEEDWYIPNDSKTVLQRSNDKDSVINGKKIIASTDPRILFPVPESLAEYPFSYTQKKYPQLSQEFINLYIEEYNADRKIKKVEIKYDSFPTMGEVVGNDVLRGEDCFYPEINPDNTINIRLPKKELDESALESWNSDKFNEELFGTPDAYCAGFVEGRKGTYSEEDLREAWKSGYNKAISSINEDRFDEDDKAPTFEQWFEFYKRK